MAAWSTSPFLQALGWAMLNSLWQMASLYVGFALLTYLIKPSSQQRYYAALGTIAAGFMWFVFTFILYYKQGVESILWQHGAAPTSETWNLVLSSASLAYILLLTVPAYRLFKTWQHIEHLKKSVLYKTALEYRLFVKKIAQQLGIKRTVHLYLSHLVQAPVTIGYLKPIILLPIAAINNLSPHQVEAVLLHELSHIKRYDYLINFIITFLQTFFYFNPFVKQFALIIEFEREKCCDELVIQFQYDKISYASALLELEKGLLYFETLVIAAADKKHLLRRIEKIIGNDKKIRFTIQQFTGLIASLLVVLFTNSLFFINKQIQFDKKPFITALESPLYQFDISYDKATTVKKPTNSSHITTGTKAEKNKLSNNDVHFFASAEPRFSLIDSNMIQASFDLDQVELLPEQNDQVKQVLQATKDVLRKTKWKEVESAIGDGMTASEKQIAKYQYAKELNKVDWKTLESHLKSSYSDINWDEIDTKLNAALQQAQLDSLQTVYNQLLVQLQQKKGKTPILYNNVLPLPDVSKSEILQLENTLQSKLDSLNTIRIKKVIDF